MLLHCLYIVAIFVSSRLDEATALLELSYRIMKLYQVWVIVMHVKDMNKLVLRKVINRDNSKLGKFVRVPDQRLNLLDPSLGSKELFFELLRFSHLRLVFSFGFLELLYVANLTSIRLE